MAAPTSLVAPQATRADSTERPRVWLVSAVQHENVDSTTHILERLAEALAETHPIERLSARPIPPSRPPGEAAFGSWLTDRLRRALLGCMRVITHALRDVRQGDAVVVVTNPPILPALMTTVARLRRGTLIIIVHDVYPDVLEATGLLSPGSITGRLLERVSRHALRGADRVVVIGRDMQRRVAAKLDGAADHVVFIPNWADPDIEPDFSVDSAMDTRPLVVQYSGNMGVSHPVEVLIDCAEMLQHEQAPVEFHVFGWGLKLPAFRAEVERRRLRNVVIGPRCRRGDLGAQLAASDVGLVLMRRGMAGVSVPCRAYNILAAGRPLIVAADADAEIAALVREYDVGWIVEPEDPGSLAAAIRTAARLQRVALRELGRRAASVAAEQYSFDRAVARYRRLIDDVHAPLVAAMPATAPVP